MFWEKFLIFLKGYVDFRAEGGFPERFINLCSANGVDIKNVKMFRETINASCSVKAYRKIRKIAKKSGMKVRVTGKHGMPFFIHRNRNRTGIIFGFIFMIIVTSFLSDRIWVVNVKGNEQIPAEEIISSFYDSGVRTGIRKESLDAKEIARTALTEVDGLMWNAVNINGCKVTIEIKEQVKKDIMPVDDGVPSNIVASNSGQVTRIENFVGTAVVEVGSAVEKGDVIVSGAVINKDESVSFYKAEANVIAKTKNTVSVMMPSVQDMRVYKRDRSRNLITFFSFRFPVSFVNKPKGNSDFSVSENFLSSSGEKLPVGITKERYASYEDMKVKISPVALRLMCAEKYFREIDENYDETEITDTSSKKDFCKDYVVIESVFQCVENIAESKVMDLKTEDN